MYLYVYVEVLEIFLNMWLLTYGITTASSFSYKGSVYLNRFMYFLKINFGSQGVMGPGTLSLALVKRNMKRFKYI